MRNPPRPLQCKGIHRGFDPTEKKKHPSPDYITPFAPLSPSVEKEKFQKCSFQVVISRLFLCLRWLLGKCIVFHFAFSSMNIRGFLFLVFLFVRNEECPGVW